MKAELEVAKKLMESSLIEKQDFIATLREQLDQMKKLNIKSAETLKVYKKTI